MKAEQKLRMAHDRIAQLHPIMVAGITCRWKSVEAPDKPTMATDGRHLYWNREFTDKHELDTVTCVVLHEAAHVGVCHHLRMAHIPEVDHKTANIAADLALNDLLRNDYSLICGGRVPEFIGKHLLYPGQGPYKHLPAGESFEYYYNKLKEENDEQEQEEQQDGDDQAGGQDNPDETGGGADRAGDSGSDEVDDDTPTEDGTAEGDQGGSDQGDADQCEDGGEGSGGEESGEGGGEPAEDGGEGSGGDGDGEGPGGESSGGDGGADTPGEGAADGGADGGEPSAGQGGAPGDGEGSGGTPTIEQSIFGELMPCPADDPDAEERDLKHDLARAQMMGGHGWGTEPGSFEQAVDDMIDPRDLVAEKQINWRAKLRQFITKVSKGGYSYRRPNRRKRHLGVMLPANISRGKTHGVLITDTSGSMSVEEMNVALREMENILGEYRSSTVKLISCDAQVFEGKTYMSYDFPIIEHEDWKGRGGTNLRPAFEWAYRSNPRPDWIVCVSDMEWDFYNIENAGIPVLWLQTRDSWYADHHEPKVGQVLPVQP